MGEANSISDEQKKNRDKLVSCLRIDCLNKRADYAKFYGDIEGAKEDYMVTLDIIKEFPEGNDSIKSSINFSLGKLHLDISKHKEALPFFQEAQTIIKQQVLSKLKEFGQELGSDTSIADLVKPSIFDDDVVRDRKALLVEVGEFINECNQMDQIQPQLDQMKKEA